MKKIYLLILLTISACGYTPLYGELGSKMNEIGLDNVSMKHVRKDIGERRLAQKMSQDLSRVFSNNYDNDYAMTVELEIKGGAIATKSDDTDQRRSVVIVAYVKLKDTSTNQVVFKTRIQRKSSYTTQDEPFATEAARSKALESVGRTLSGDIIQRSALWFRGYTENETNK